MNNQSPQQAKPQNVSQQSKEPTTSNTFVQLNPDNSMNLDSEQALRLECLRISALAFSGTSTSTRTDVVLAAAQRLERYILSGSTDVSLPEV